MNILLLTLITDFKGLFTICSATEKNEVPVSASKTHEKSTKGFANFCTILDNEYDIGFLQGNLSHQNFAVPSFAAQLNPMKKFTSISSGNVLVNIYRLSDNPGVYKRAGEITSRDIQSIRVHFSPRTDQKEPELASELRIPQIIVIFEKGRFYNTTLLLFICPIPGKT
jgi:hypothetical protein